MGLGPSETAHEVDAAVAEARKELTFFVALVTKDPYWNDLDQKGPHTNRQITSG